MRIAKVKDSLETALKAGIKVDSVIDVGIQHATPVLIDLFPNQHHYSIRPFLFAILVLLLALCFPTLDGYADPPRSRIDLPLTGWRSVGAISASGRMTKL